VKVRLSEEARADLLRIGDHIAKDNPLRAREMVRELRIRAMEIGGNPLLFPLVPHHERSGIRRRVFGNYLIFYLIEDEVVNIVHILYGAQNYEAMLFPDS
jgi:plasmid stabilization system protein ParE